MYWPTLFALRHLLRCSVTRLQSTIVSFWSPRTFPSLTGAWSTFKSSRTGTNGCTSRYVYYMDRPYLSGVPMLVFPKSHARKMTHRVPRIGNTGWQHIRVVWLFDFGSSTYSLVRTYFDTIVQLYNLCTRRVPAASVVGAGLPDEGLLCYRKRAVDGYRV